MWRAEWLRLRADWLFYRQLLLGSLLNQVLVTVGAFWVVSLLADKSLATLMALFFWQYASVPLSRVAADIWEETSTGAFEQTYLHAGAPVAVLFVRLCLYFVRQSALQLPVFAALALLSFGWAPLASYPWFGFALSLALTLASLAGLGLVVGGVLLVSRNAISYASAAEYALLFLSGVIVPIAALPAPLQALAPWLPLSLGVEALRRLEAGAAPYGLLLLLGVQAAALLLLGLAVFRVCLARALRRGFAMGR
ncbi:ABC transporter permease [Truepera radiovictrix]|uniref:ABC-2 type transporter n=1 Tax=Truepera radiovictrix (strain DSM 17093 / CIP 108686 / LMG 22925 / RQ-24) TaxID=649638 RepID=D7CS83_TRURR|nr:ABC transporter permease [Truepera radiovictrix]ADI13615.1 ABC-2 type transporter [Truepera radiovictrix DSM 17093]WMT57823.1 ABC transporter permease [Truepera radiovictrix]